MRSFPIGHSKQFDLRTSSNQPLQQASCTKDLIIGVRRHEDHSARRVEPE